MYLKDLAKIIYEPGTASESLPIKITTISSLDDIIWDGTAKELQNIVKLNNYGRLKNVGKWSVCEIIRFKITTNDTPDIIPIYNRGIHITIY